MTPIFALCVRSDTTEFRPLTVPVARIEDDGTQPTRLIHDCAGPDWLVALYLPGARINRLTLMGEPLHGTYGEAVEALRDMHRRTLAQQGLQPEREPSAERYAGIDPAERTVEADRKAYNARFIP